MFSLRITFSLQNIRDEVNDFSVKKMLSGEFNGIQISSAGTV